MRRKPLTISALFTFLMLLNLLPAVAQELTTAEVETLYNDYFNAEEFDYVTVHDPSVVIGYQQGGVISGEYSADATKVYYIFGSHRAWAYSYDLQNWTTFSNNLNSSYASILAGPAEWSANGSTNYDVSGNMWAPDIIWNTQMQKWCLYMSVNGDYWYSSIVLLTANSLDGDWTYVGPVVYSGFTNQTEAAETDFYDVVSASEPFPSRYNLNRNGVHTYGQNAIDPGLIYDEEGNLWMAYGSWFGGIYMLRLDAATGLRDYSYTYATTDGTAVGATSDEYQGLKIAGGNHASGEGAYIQNINGTYYLFMTNGGLVARGGYNMRVFASENVTGPYVDMTGQDARYSASNTGAGSINGTVGLRLMSYYQYGWMDDGFTAQGHNSAIVDDDGKSFLVYHTRFNDGTEGHQVRVHQLFQTKNGYLAAAPFEYSGETLATDPYEADEIVGRYGILYHGTGTDYANLECVEEEEIVLNANGTVSGAYVGGWSQEADGPYITLTLNNVTFQGVLLNQKMEGLNYAPLGFTAVGNDVSVFGYQMAGEGKPFPDDAAVAYSVYNLSGTIPSEMYSGAQLSLPSEGYYGATYEWSWDTSLISPEGIVGDVETNTTTDLTFTITSGSYTYTDSYSIELVAQNISELLPIEERAVMATFANPASFAEATPNNAINAQTGLSLSFYVENIASDWDLIAHSSDNLYRLFLSVLHYGGRDFYEAKATLSEAAIAAGFNTSSAWTIFLNTSCYATVSYNPDGSVSYYKDGELMLTFEPSITPSFGSGVTPADIVPLIVSYYRTGQIEFDYDVKNIVVGYSADLDLDTYEPLDISEYAFYEDYDYYGSTTSWDSPNGALTYKLSSNTNSHYVEVSTDGGTGNRSAINTFSGVDDLSTYNFTLDARLVTGNVNDRSVSEVAVISTDNANENNSTTESGYIFRLVTPTYNGSNGGTWYVNGDESNSLTIASGIWVTIRGNVDVNAKTAEVTIFNRGTGDTIYTGTTAINGNGILKGLWLLAGRGNGVIGIDNIQVKNGFYVEEVTGISDLEAGIDLKAELEVYNLLGVRVAYGKLSSMHLPTGLYVARQGQHVQKIYVTGR